MIQINPGAFSRALAKLDAYRDAKSQNLILVEVVGNELVLKGSGSGVEFKTAPIECMNLLQQEVSVGFEFDGLNRLLGGFRNVSTIYLEQEESMVKLSAEKSTYQLPYHDPLNVPTSLDMEGDTTTTIKVNASVLLQAMISLEKSMPTDDVRAHLNGLRIEVMADVIHLVTTDGHRLTKVSLDDLAIEGEEIAVTLPSRGIVPMLKKLLVGVSDDIEIALCSTFVNVTFPYGEVIKGRLIDNSFPDWRRVISELPHSQVTFDRSDLQSALSRLTACVTEKHKGVTFTFKDEELELEGYGANKEGGRECISASCDIDTVIRFNVAYLNDAINSVLPRGEQKVVLEILNQNSPVRILNNNAIGLVMPVRL